MKKTYLFFLLSLISLHPLFSQGIGDVLEGESLTLVGSTEISANTNASGGSFVKLKKAAPSGSLQFVLSNVTSSGNYKMEVFTFNNGTSVNASLKVNEEATATITFDPSNWAYQGDAKSTTIDIVLQEGNNTITIGATESDVLIDKIVVSEKSSIYYVSADGDDTNDGSINAPWKTLAKATLAAKKTSDGGVLEPGDQLLFRKGDTFKGQFTILCSGTKEKPIVISSYGTGELPILSGSGNIPTGDYIETIKMNNTSYITLEALWIKNHRKNKGNITWGTNTAYGIKVIANKWGGVSKGLTFRDLKVTDVYAIDMLDYEGNFTLDFYNARGIFLDADKDDISVTPRTKVGIDDVLVEGCYFYNLGSTAFSTRHLSHVVNNPIEEEERNLNYIIRNNHFEKLGADGIVLSSVCNAIVEKNTFIDLGLGDRYDQNDLLFGRGEGCWIWNTRNVVVQFNKQYRARGFGDTYASGHVDFYCNNSIFQYNYSEDTEGGFVEILGECENTTYRYNVSKNDGFRDHHGYSIWVSGYVGAGNDPVRSNNNYIYNNTVLLNKDGYKPDVSIYAKNTYIYNNIFKAVDGAQMGAEEVKIDIENGSELIVDNNLFFGDVATAFSDLDANKITDKDPLFINESDNDIDGFQLQEGSPAINSGKAFPEPSFPMAGQGIFENFSLYTATDIYGNAIDVQNLIPNVGADNNFNDQLQKDDIRVTGVSVSTIGNVLSVDETAQLTATVIPSNAALQSMTWSSSHPEIATVSNTGLVTAISDGQAVITVKTDDGHFTATSSITVKTEVNLVVNGDFENGLSAEWTTWNNPQVTADAYEGTQAITITDKGSANQWVNVKANTTYILSGYIKIDNTSKRIVLGVNDQDNNAMTSKDIYSGVYTYHEVEFESGNNTAVKVYTWLPASDGATATIDNIKLVEKAFVVIPVSGVNLAPQSETFYVGEQITLVEDVLPNEATNKTVTWQSSNSAIATVYNGVVTAQGVGTVTITVTTADGNFTASTEVTVSASSIPEFKNGGFEDGLNFWNTWQRMTTTTEEAYEGSALRLDGVASCTQTVVVKPNTNYTLSGYVKVDNPTSARVVFGVNDENKVNMKHQDITGQNYTYYEVNFTTSANQTSIIVYFWRPSGGTGYAYLDNAMLIENANSSARKQNSTASDLLAEKVIVYPNPASDFITIKVEKNTGVNTLEVYDVIGQRRIQKTFETSLRLGITDLSKGTYFAMITCGDGQRLTKQFIVK
ncbi:Ig-like domain-containing protein [Flammeovirga sp. OC4]|uniref:Ig-like domain-containing protein n=1 Tax=Flammeovirga sp. OC4 TaxID=1382345 RepID=UPI00069392C8|nr:Ig-like domain-containing protein [Flammeovirga sp. OC4]